MDLGHFERHNGQPGNSQTRAKLGLMKKKFIITKLFRLYALQFSLLIQSASIPHTRLD